MNCNWLWRRILVIVEVGCSSNVKHETKFQEPLVECNKLILSFALDFESQCDNENARKERKISCCASRNVRNHWAYHRVQLSCYLFTYLRYCCAPHTTWCQAADRPACAFFSSPYLAEINTALRVNQIYANGFGIGPLCAPTREESAQF